MKWTTTFCIATGIAAGATIGMMYWANKEIKEDIWESEKRINQRRLRQELKRRQESRES